MTEHTLTHDVTMNLVEDYGDEILASWTFELTIGFDPGSPEYIPPRDRPDLYDPGSAPEIGLSSVKFITQGSAELVTEHNNPIFWQWCQIWVERHKDTIIDKALDETEEQSP